MKLSELKKLASENGISLKHLNGKMLKKSKLAEKLMSKGVMVKSPKKSRKPSREKSRKKSRKPKKASRKPKKTSRKPKKKLKYKFDYDLYKHYTKLKWVDGKWMLWKEGDELIPVSKDVSEHIRKKWFPPIQSVTDGTLMYVNPQVLDA